MITAEGLQKLRDEHDHLWKVERPDVTAKVFMGRQFRWTDLKNADLSLQ